MDEKTRLAVAVVMALGAISSGCGGAKTPVAAEIAATGPGRATVVEFVDYRCDFCRQLHEVLAPLLEQHEGQIRFVVRHVPLARHAGADRAAAAAICAEEQGKLAAVHDLLLRAPDAREETLRELGTVAGLEVTRFEDCMRGDLPKQRIEEDREAYEAMGGDGLPMVFFGEEKVVGLADIEVLEAALGRAIDDAR